MLAAQDAPTTPLRATAASELGDQPRRQWRLGASIAWTNTPFNSDFWRRRHRPGPFGRHAVRLRRRARRNHSLPRISSRLSSRKFRMGRGRSAHVRRLPAAGAVWGGSIRPVIWQWNFTSAHKIAPYVAAVGGIVFTRQNVPPGDTSQVNFTPGIAFGSNVFVKHRRALFFEGSIAHLPAPASAIEIPATT